jgi:hypothetical protein
MKQATSNSQICVQKTSARDKLSLIKNSKIKIKINQSSYTNHERILPEILRISN